MTTLKDIEMTENPQSFFDNFNGFMLNKDRRIFNKLIARTLLYNDVKDIPGDIVECGVFKGTGIYTFLKLKYLFNPNSSKKVVGFDFFDTDSLLASITNPDDKDTMDVLFSGRGFKHGESYYDLLNDKIISDGFSQSDFELIKGDVSLTTEDYARNNIGFRISLLFMDVDLGIPTYNTLNNLWDNIARGGIVVFDEYGYNKWSESDGVDRFVKERNLDLKCLNFMSPTAYIKKVL
jgi:hypothetical protein